MSRVIFSIQYNTPCIVPHEGATADHVINDCIEEGAVYYEDGPEDRCFVVQLRPLIGPELWTESALRRTPSLKGGT